MRLDEESCFEREAKREDEYNREEEANGRTLIEQKRQTEASKSTRRRRRTRTRSGRDRTAARDKTSAMVEMQSSAGEGVPFLELTSQSAGGSSRSSTTSTTNLAPSSKASNCFLRHHHHHRHNRRHNRHHASTDQLAAHCCTCPTCFSEPPEVSGSGVEAPNEFQKDNHCDSNTGSKSGKTAPVVRYCRCFKGKFVTEQEGEEEEEERGEAAHEQRPLLSLMLVTQLGRDQKGEETEDDDEEGQVKFETDQRGECQELASGQVGRADWPLRDWPSEMDQCGESGRRTGTKCANIGPIDESSRQDECRRAPPTTLKVETSSFTDKTAYCHWTRQSPGRRQDIDIGENKKDNSTSRRSPCPTAASQMLVKPSSRTTTHESVSVRLEYNQRRPGKQLQGHQASVLMLLFVYTIFSIVSNSSLLSSLFQFNNVVRTHYRPLMSSEPTSQPLLMAHCDNSISIGSGSIGWLASAAPAAVTISPPTSPFIMFASAEVHQSSRKPKSGKAGEQQDRKHAPTSTTLGTTASPITVEDEDSLTQPVEFGFRHKSEGELVIAEGGRLPLWCKLKSHLPVTWMKDKSPIFDDKMKKVEITAERFNFIGNLSDNDWSIELVNAQQDDSGLYWCQIAPDQVPTSKNRSDLIAETRLTVTPAPVLTLPPITANSLTTTDQNGQEDHTSNHQGHYIGPLSQTSSSSTSDNNLIGSNNYLDSFSSSKSTVNNNKAREAVPTTAIKLSNGYLSPAPYNYNQHHHSTVRASTIATNSPGLLGGNGSGAGMHSVALIWPYLLLALAALLMLANIYLIFSLIKRHTRCSKEEEANEEHEDDDPSLA